MGLLDCPAWETPCLALGMAGARPAARQRVCFVMNGSADFLWRAAAPMCLPCSYMPTVRALDSPLLQEFLQDFAWVQAGMPAALERRNQRLLDTELPRLPALRSQASKRRSCCAQPCCPHCLRGAIAPGNAPLGQRFAISSCPSSFLP